MDQHKQSANILCLNHFIPLMIKLHIYFLPLHSMHISLLIAKLFSSKTKISSKSSATKNNVAKYKKPLPVGIEPTTFRLTAERSTY